MQDSNSVSALLSKTIKLTVPIQSTNNPTINAPYAKATGSIMYLALGSQPNLAFVVQHLSQFTTAYGLEHWTAIKHMLRYLKGTQDDGLTFIEETGLDLKLFVDADYMNQANALFIGGYVAMLGGGSITCSSKKQRMVALSTMEAEYIALTEGTKQLVWLRGFLPDLGIDQSQPTLICSDNFGTITLSHDTEEFALGIDPKSLHAMVLMQTVYNAVVQHS